MEARVMYTFITSAQETEVRLWILAQPEFYRETLPQKIEWVNK